MQKKFKILLQACLFAISSVPASAANLTDEQCALFRGIWVGTATGHYRGEMRMEVAENCSYRISGQFDTPGRLSYSNWRNVVEYRNDLGSRGVVEATGQTLRMWNAYTGNNYEIIWRRGR